MKALYLKSIIEVHNPGSITRYFVTDIHNNAYLLAKEICNKTGFGDYFFEVLKKQKSIRAVVQKFNSICKALEL